MKEKIKSHIQPCIDLSEMETANMIKILEKLSMTYLKLLAEKLEAKEKEDYSQALFDIRNPEIDNDCLRQAERVVMTVVEKHGKLLLVGDQLTVVCIESAMQARKDHTTDFESFKYILGVKPGNFHLEMNVVIKNYQSLMKTISGTNQASP